MQPEKVTYSETVRPPLWLLAFIFFLLASVALAIWAAFDNQAGLIALILSFALLPLINQAMLLRIFISSSELRVGRAHIARDYLGSARSLSITEMRLTRGRDADPAAYLALRFWQPRGIKVDLRDTRDPTPYWLISSKNASRLVDALRTPD